MKIAPESSCLHVEAAGQGDVTLLLIHGLGANAAVWDPLLPFVERDWKGRCLIPDLAGHGRSPMRPNYSLGAFASDLAGLFAPGQKIHVIGHSLGGALGALLGTGWFGVDVARLLALSVKTKWSEAEVEKGRSVARNPVRWRDTRAEAEEAFARAAGLSTLIARAPRSLALGVAEADGRFRVAADPAIFGSAALGIDRVLASARCPLIYATGEHDAMAPAKDSEAAGIRTQVIAGAGHNVHVEAPEAVWALFMAGR